MSRERSKKHEEKSSGLGTTLMIGAAAAAVIAAGVTWAMGSDRELEKPLSTNSPSSVLDHSTDAQTEKPIICRICLERLGDSLILPCRHAGFCTQCLAQLHACPICRGSKTETMQIFLS